MADEREATFPRERLISLAAVAALAMATALGFGRVFLGGSPTAKLLAAAAAAAVLAVAVERRSLPVATLAGAAGLVLAVSWLVLADTTRFGLPTGETLAAIAEALADVGRQAREQVSPTLALTPLLLAAVTAVWSATFAIHALAVRAGSPLLALIPSAALVGFADSALKGRGPLAFATLLLVGVIAVLLADGIRRVRQWGSMRPWRGPSGRARIATARGAAGVAAVSVLGALILPGLLPGFGAGPLLDLRSHGSDASIDPLVSIRAQLTRREPQRLFSVTADRPAYWRMLALDRFDGTTWSTADFDASDARTIASDQPIAGQPLEGAASLQQEVTVATDLGFSWIPAAFAPERIALSQPGFRYNQSLGMAVALEPLESGETYAVTSRYVVPTPEQLDAVTFDAAVDYGYTDLPSSVPPKVERIASDWTANAQTPYEEIRSIQDHLLRFQYDATVAPRADTDALVEFLTETKSGFCQQFASAMAVLVRSLGYPARVAVGFTQGTQSAPGEPFDVTTRDAHSWVEVLFPDYGWLAFEPTPNRVNPIAQPYASPAVTGCPPSGCEDPRNLRGDGSVARGRRGEGVGIARRREPQQPGRVPEPVRRRPAASVPVGNLFLVLLGIFAVAAILIPPVKHVRRRLRLAAAREPRDLALASYDVFAARAADVGLGRRPGETMEEHERRLRRAVGASDGHLQRLTRVASRAAYAPPDDVGRAEARDAHRAARLAFRHIRRERGALRQLLGTYRRGL